MNDSYTKAACGCPGGWSAPSRLESALLNIAGVAGGLAFIAGKAWSVAQAMGWA